MKCLYETDVFYKIGSWRRNLCNERENIYQQNISFDITCVWYTLIIFICALLLQCKSCTVYLYWCHILGTIMIVYCIVISIITRKTRKIHPVLWISGIISCMLGFIVCMFVFSMLIVLMAAKQVLKPRDVSHYWSRRSVRIYRSCKYR